MSNNIDPEALANRLPDRPLTPDEVGDLGDELGWSVSQETHQSEDGNEYVPRWFAFRPTEAEPESEEAVGTDVEGDALVFYLDDESGEWVGILEQTGVSQSTWIEVCDAYAAEMGMEANLSSIVAEGPDGPIEREFPE